VAAVLRLKTVTKRHVLARDEGKDLGRPVDILVDPQRHEVSLIVLTQGSLPELSVVVKAEAIGLFDTDVLSVASVKELHLAVHDELLVSQLQAGAELRRRPVFTTQGMRLGNIDAVEIDARGNVTGYRVRRPRLGLVRSRLLLKPADMRGLGAEFATVIPPTPEPKAEASGSAPKPSP
jgi:sporulation protein YlmC with PRC-barrel domain